MKLRLEMVSPISHKNVFYFIIEYDRMWMNVRILEKKKTCAGCLICPDGHVLSSNKLIPFHSHQTSALS